MTQQDVTGDPIQPGRRRQPVLVAVAGSESPNPHLLEQVVRLLVTSPPAQIGVNGRPVAPEETDELVHGTLGSTSPAPERAWPSHLDHIFAGRGVCVRIPADRPQREAGDTDLPSQPDVLQHDTNASRTRYVTSPRPPGRGRTECHCQERDDSTLNRRSGRPVTPHIWPTDYYGLSDRRPNRHVACRFRVLVGSQKFGLSGHSGSRWRAPIRLSRDPRSECGASVGECRC